MIEEEIGETEEETEAGIAVDAAPVAAEIMAAVFRIQNTPRLGVSPGGPPYRPRRASRTSKLSSLTRV